MRSDSLKWRAIAAAALLILACGAQARPTQLANAPMSSASSIEISTNILFVLDDSLSMTKEYLPDWAEPTAARPLPLSWTRNPGFNGIAYNPAVRYIPPKYFAVDGAADTTTYPSQTSAQSGAWTAVKDDGYGVQSAAMVNLIGNAYYFTTVVGEYCTNRSLRVCVAASAASDAYPFPARLRWCRTAADAVAAAPADGTCQATQIEPSPPPPATATNVSYDFPRMPSPRTSTITISGNSNTSVTNVTVDGRIILSAATTGTSNSTTMAANIASRINDCSFALSGACQVAGYRAVSAGRVVTVTSPLNNSTAPVITQSNANAMSFTTTSFARPGSNLAPGENLLTIIYPTVTSYPKGDKRTDCAGDATCTYAEEMTNYANWWAYYRTRMQTMKTATSLSFEPTDQRQRIGYMSINNNTGSDFQNVESFTAAQKKAWYDKLFAAVPNRNTPLRVALSNAGRLYSGQLNGSTFNGVSVVDPVQYYCQKNVTILSTDGYWNEGAGFRWDGASAIGDQDGPGLEERPQLDGGGPQDQETRTQTTRTRTPTLATQSHTRIEQTRARTSELQTRTNSILQANNYVWQERTSLLQRRTGPLQSRTRPLEIIRRDRVEVQTSQLRRATGQLQMVTSLLQQQLTQVQQRTSSNGGTSFGAWSDVASCTPVTNGTNRVDCQTLAQTGWTGVSACSTINGGTRINNPGTDSQTTTYTTDSQCRYSSPSTTNVTSCTASGTASSGPNYTGNLVTCSMVWSQGQDATTTCNESATEICWYSGWSGWTAWSGPGSCTDQPQSTGPSFTQVVARNCQTSWAQAWQTADASGCTPVPNSVLCQFGAWTAWTDNPSCVPVAAPTGDVSSATPPPVECQVNGALEVGVSLCTPVSSGAIQTQCSYTDWGPWTEVGSCTPVPQSAGQGVARECQQVWTGYNNAATCVPSATTLCQYVFTDWTATTSCTATTPASPLVPNARQCQYTAWSAYADANSCTEAPRSGRPAVAVQCSTRLISNWTDTNGCTPGTSNTGLITLCGALTVPPPQVDFVPPDTCVEELPDAATNGGVGVTCHTERSGPTNVAQCTRQDPVAGNNYLQIACDVASLGPTPDTLADVAEYYWKTDLRDSVTIPGSCSGGPVVAGGVTTYNDVCYNDPDAQPTGQHMTTYTLGLGASGLMQYNPNYLSRAETSGDFYSIREGLTADPSTGVCPWQRSGPCNWPKPESDKQTNIDDLWHAAVNGRGIYFSASDPSTLAAGISDALSNIEIQAGALAAVAVVSPNLVADANGFFEVSFKVGEWSGDVVKRTINGSTGALSALPAEGEAHVSPGWSARERLDNKVATDGYASRKIYTYNPGGESVADAANNLKFFTWANLTTAQRAYFATDALAGNLSQFCSTGTICLTATTQTAASGEPLVNFLRGDTSNQGSAIDTSAYYRQRTHILGDIVGSEAAYVQASPWNYADAQYGAFRTANHTRTGMIYIGANDGMLHAFNATSGAEEWAYIPAVVIPRLAKLADKSYHLEGAHQFTVDGTPVMGDICISDCGTSSAVWKTILVGGLNNGGRGYYALDVTDPVAPKALWEFTQDSNENLGYSYGNPVISKLKDGTWVVMVTSGYNNISPGDGGGHLFVLNASTGALIRTISTGVGDTTTPSGLSRISAWANFPDNNNTTQRIYGGDQFGNLWRFDVNGDIPLVADPPVYDAQRLATLKDADGVAQPITTKPELGKVSSHPVVFVATGQLLGSDDLGTTQKQSMYAIKDRLLDSDYGSPRPLTPAQTIPTPGTFVAQTLTSGTCPEGNAYCTSGDSIVTSSNNAVDFNTHDGWYIDFPVFGERVNTEMRLQLGTLAFNTNTPTVGACRPVGVSFAYYLDYRSGAAVEGTDGMAARRLGDYLSASPSIVRLLDGTIRALVRTDAPSTVSAPVPTAATPLDTRRVSWRELVTEQ
ncbi:MAG TPA: PilC/PilY family type IV pilus protein [Accumulibacter sp.]|nr:PilC/PilY family type IV pilus protein [Accumulibacter sp.]